MLRKRTCSLRIIFGIEYPSSIVDVELVARVRPRGFQNRIRNRDLPLKERYFLERSILVELAVPKVRQDIKVLYLSSP